MKVTLDHITQESATIRTFYFKPEKPIHYVAGQFIELSLPHDQPDDRGTKRWFTLSSTPGEEHISITTRYAGDTASSSFKRTLFGLQNGDDVHMSEPMGDFVLPKDPTIPLIFVAGGIGITPFHSMAGWLHAQHEHRDIRCMYGVRGEDDIVFQETFKKADIHETIVVQNPSDAWGGERGGLTTDVVLGVGAPDAASLIFLSGPEPLIEALTKDLGHHGISKSQLVTDFFPGYTEF
jgi:ferredoxin-NADP reductase